MIPSSLWMLHLETRVCLVYVARAELVLDAQATL